MSPKLIKAITGCVLMAAVVLIIPRGPRDKGFDNDKAREYFEMAQSANSLEEALKYYDLADKASPNTPMILHERGLTRCNLGMREEGMADMDRSIELTVEADAKEVRYLNRGLTQMEMQNMDEACSDFKNAGSWGTEYIEKYCK